MSEDVNSNDRNINVDWFASVSVGELLRSLWNFRASIVLTSVALATLLVGVVYLLPVKYDSDAQLLVRLGRNTLSTDPTSSITPTISVQETRLSQVGSVKEMLQSRALSEEIVRRVGADRILQPHGYIEERLQDLMSLVPVRRVVDTPGEGLSAEESALHLKQEEALAKLENSVQITLAKNAYTIHVRVRTGSPYLSRDLLSALIELYQVQHVNAYHSDGTLPFFESQTTQSYKEAVASKEMVREAKDAMGIIEIDAARMALREQLTQAHRELDQVVVDLASATSEVQRYEIEMENLPERVQSETVTGITSNKSDGMRQQLYQLEVQVNELSSKLREDHPQLRAIRDQLESATQIAEQERKEQPQNREALNPVYQQIEIAYRSGLVRREGLTAKRQALETHLTNLNEKVIELNHNELDLTKLTWQATLAENVYLQNAQNRDKAKLINALDLEGLSEIAVVQPASLQLKKSSPKRAILLVAAALLAIGIAFLQAVARTVVAHSVHEPIVGRQRSTAGLLGVPLDHTSRHADHELDDVESESSKRDYAVHVK